MQCLKQTKYEIKGTRLNGLEQSKLNKINKKKLASHVSSFDILFGISKECVF